MNVYTGVHSYYCAPLLTREAKSICTQEPCMFAFWTKMEKRSITKTFPASPTDFFKPLNRFGAISLLAWSAFSAGTGWPMYAKRKGSTLCWVTPFT